MNVCWGPDEAEARKTAHHFWPNGGLSGQMMQDLPTWTHFDEATSLVTEDDAVSSIPCGPDIGPIVESVKKFLDAGDDHLYSRSEERRAGKECVSTCRSRWHP